MRAGCIMAVSMGTSSISLELLKGLIFLLELELLLKGFLPLELLDSIDALVSVAGASVLLEEVASGSDSELSALALEPLALELDSFAGSIALELLLFSDSLALEETAFALELELISSLSSLPLSDESSLASEEEEISFASELEETFFALELDDATFALELEEWPSASAELEISVFFSVSVELALTASLSQLAQKAAVRARTAFLQCLCKKMLIESPSMKSCSKNKKKTFPRGEGKSENLFCRCCPRTKRKYLFTKSRRIVRFYNFRQSLII